MPTDFQSDSNLDCMKANPYVLCHYPHEIYEQPLMCALNRYPPVKPIRQGTKLLLGQGDTC